MKAVLHSNKKARAEKILSLFPQEHIDYVKEFKDEIDNLIVYEYEPLVDDFVESDPTEEIEGIAHVYVMDGICENLIDDGTEFETIYEALCQLEESA